MFEHSNSQIESLFTSAEVSMQHQNFARAVISLLKVETQCSTNT